MRAYFVGFALAALFTGTAHAQEKASEPAKTEKAAKKAAKKAADKSADKSAAATALPSETPAPPAGTTVTPGALPELLSTTTPFSSPPPPPAAPTEAAAPPTAPAPPAAPAPAATPPTPGTTPAATSKPPSDWRSRWNSFDAVMSDVRVTDVAIVLFALLVTLFALASAIGSARLRRIARRQADDHQRAIGASEKAAEQTLAALRDSSERQLRAYVTVRQFLQTPVKDERQSVHGWLLQVAWQNTGVTPTKGFRYWAMLREFERAIPDEFDFAPPGLKDFAGGELGSNGTVNSPPLFVSQQQIAKLQDGSRKMLLLGQADYQDMVRDAKHETRFCVELVLVNDPGGANGSPFSFSYHPKYNTVT